jgi:hypothetical protein
VNTSVENQLTKSFAGASDIAAQHPQYANQIMAAAKQSFLHGDQWAYTAGSLAVVLGATIVFFCFPRKVREDELLASYHAQDAVPQPPAEVVPLQPKTAGGA